MENGRGGDRTHDLRIQNSPIPRARRCKDLVYEDEIRSEADLEEACDTERHLLYVACTRARDHLLVTAVDPGSEFLEDLRR